PAFGPRPDRPRQPSAGSNRPVSAAWYRRLTPGKQRRPGVRRHHRQTAGTSGCDSPDGRQIGEIKYRLERPANEAGDAFGIIVRILQRVLPDARQWWLFE